MRSNRSGSFYNVSQIIQEACFQEWRSFSRKPFCLALYSENKKYLTPLIGSLITMMVNKFDLGLQNPVTYADKKT